MGVITLHLTHLHFQRIVNWILVNDFGVRSK